MAWMQIGSQIQLRLRVGVQLKEEPQKQINKGCMTLIPHSTCVHKALSHSALFHSYLSAEPTCSLKVVSLSSFALKIPL